MCGKDHLDSLCNVAFLGFNFCTLDPSVAKFLSLGNSIVFPVICHDAPSYWNYISVLSMKSNCDQKNSVNMIL